MGAVHAVHAPPHRREDSSQVRHLFLAQRHEGKGDERAAAGAREAAEEQHLWGSGVGIRDEGIGIWD